MDTTFLGDDVEIIHTATFECHIEFVAHLEGHKRGIVSMALTHEDKALLREDHRDGFVYNLLLVDDRFGFTHKRTTFVAIEFGGFTNFFHKRTAQHRIATQEAFETRFFAFQLSQFTFNRDSSKFGQLA